MYICNQTNVMTNKELTKELRLRGVKIPNNASKLQLENLLLAAEITDKPILSEEELVNVEIQQSLDKLKQTLLDAIHVDRNKAPRYNSAIAHIKQIAQICKL